MARRSSSAPQANLDSLLDTLTNVVGILIIVLIVVQLNTGSAARRILAKMAPVTVTQFEETKAKLAEAEARVARLSAPSDAPANIEEMTKRLDQRLPELQKILSESDKEAKKAADLSKRLAELRALLAKIEGNLAPVQGRLAEIRAKIAAATPEERDAPQAKIIRLPNPREPEAGSVERRVILTGGRILVAEADKILPAVEAALRPRIGGLRSATDKNRLDRKKVEAALANFRWENEDFTGTVHNTSWGGLQVRLVPKPGRGDPAESVNQPQSAIRRAFADANLRKNHIRFLVTKDSFATYLMLRARADDGRIPVGWEFIDDKILTAFYTNALPVERDANYKPGTPGQKPQKRDTLD